MKEEDLKVIPGFLVGVPRWAVVPFTEQNTEDQDIWAGRGDVSSVCCLRTQRYSARNWIYEFKRILVYSQRCGSQQRTGGT